MAIDVHKGDLPPGLDFGTSVAVDTETLGLNPKRDRLCVVQLSGGDGNSHLVQFDRDEFDAPNLSALLTDLDITKIFHFARFDIATIRQHLNVLCAPVYCTKIASKLVRTYTDRHGLKDLCRELLKLDLNKQQQSSDWGAETLSREQLEYAAADVLYLHELKQLLDAMLEREGRTHFANACFAFLPVRAELDLAGWSEEDLFAH
ncbi:MAG: ribonuclease D [Alphaproteobacteria bacterium]|nr:ribonuclease D [Alphaproteobacteria bacterium]